MSLALRIVLVVASVSLVALVVRGIRRSRMRIEDSLFWVGLSLLILLLSIFPEIAIGFTQLLGVQSAVNFVLLFFIAVLLVKCFSLARAVSQLETKLRELSQTIAVRDLARYENAADQRLQDTDSRRARADVD